MLLEFEKSIVGSIKAAGLYNSDAKVLLAVSGGADSTALLYAMWALKTEGVFRGELICAHINHQLRGAESDEDEDFVIAQAGKLSLPITTRRLDVRGFADKNRLSIETAARKLRIESLLDIAKTNSAEWIATAHHADDNAETLVQRLARGTGFRGLGGIWPVRSFAEGISFIRPLLCVRRDEIVEYLQERNIEWRVDSTNADCNYRRNFIRHRLIPELQRQSSNSVVEQLSELSRSARKFYGFICDCAEKAWPELTDFSDGRLKLDLKSFLAQPEPVKVELVRRSLTTIGSGERDLTHQHYERILQLAEQNVGERKIELPDRFVVLREYENLFFARTEKIYQLDRQISKTVRLDVPGRTRFGRYLAEATIFESEMGGFERFKGGKNSFIEWFDFDKLNLPLVVRFRWSGESFWPLGLASEKRISKFLTAQRVPQRIRRRLLVVADSERIIWLWPIRISEQAKITDGTRKILQLQMTDATIRHLKTKTVNRSEEI